MKRSELQNLRSSQNYLSVPFAGWEDDFSLRQSAVLECLSRFIFPREILDVGCADGSFLNPLTQVHRLTGVDISPEHCQSALTNGYQRALVVDLESQRLPFEDQTFDACVLAETIEHLADTDALLIEIKRVLRPKSDLVITFPNIRTPIGLLMMLLMNLPPMFSAGYRSQHYRDFTTRSMRQALANNGFRVQRMVGIGFCVGRKPTGIWPKLANRIPSLASQVVVHATLK